ncbi:FHA domain-containing protein [Microbacterium sp. bgisy189]|uniref:FHA domain-containing protein n=1 Tax=Microbacterium sp. bgisy189 TaxID=3413798 RepID=UPI003EB756E6
MVEVRYVPSPATDRWRAVVAGDSVAVLSPDVSPLTAEAVFTRLGSGGLGALLDALTGAFGTSLTVLPSFALVSVEGGGIRVAVRGPLELVVEGTDAAEAVSGEGVSTWTERFLPGAARVTLELDGDLDAAATLPLTAGVVVASALTVTAGDAGAVSTSVAAAPVEFGMTHVPAEPESAPEPEPEPESEPEPAPEPVPDLGADDETDVEVAPTAELEASAAEVPADTWLTAAPSEDDILWGETIARPAPPVPPPPAPESLGDHDGETIAVADLRALKAREADYHSTDNVPPRQPSRGRITLSTGRVVELERTVVIGRRPKSTRTSGADLPVLVAVDSPQQDISRSHVEIRSEGEHVLVTDLNTTNGSVLLRGGQEPVRLHPGEATMVVSGDVLDIGDGVTVTFEDLP